MHARTHAGTYRNISDGISLYVSRRALFRAALIEKCHGMSEIGKLIHIFFFRYTRNARYRGSRPYFHFACLTRGAQPSASPHHGMGKGGECRKGSFRDGWGKGGERGGGTARRRIALVNASEGWCRWERTRHSCVSFLESSRRAVYIIIYMYASIHIFFSQRALSISLSPPPPLLPLPSAFWYTIEISNARGYLSHHCILERTQIDKGIFRVTFCRHLSR